VKRGEKRGVSGPGGSGKSEVIKQVIIYCKQFCKNLNVEFDQNSIRVTALTGAAAVSVFGETLDSAVGLGKTSMNFKKDEREAWARTRLLIVDEVSFMSCKKLVRLNQNLRFLKENFTSLYGGINIVFCGDFRQLEPIGTKDLPLYMAQGEAEQLWQEAINCFLELKGLGTSYTGFETTCRGVIS